MISNRKSQNGDLTPLKISREEIQNVMRSFAADPIHNGSLTPEPELFQLEVMSQYYTPERTYEYAKEYVSPFDPSKTWRPIDVSKVNIYNPPDPTTYAYGPQFGDCFVHDSGRSLFERIIRAIFCLG